MSKIEWTDKTWNPVTGCSKISPGCQNCYAAVMANRLAGRFGYPEQPNQFDVTEHRDKLSRPLRWLKPRMVFVVSMGDLFHRSVSDSLIGSVFDTMQHAHWHTFQVLTKRPKRMREFQRWWFESSHGDYLSNVWLGVSAENQEMADERIPLLLQTPAAVRFVSLEPLLGHINLSAWLFKCAFDGQYPNPMSPEWRFDGNYWQHYHGYPIGHERADEPSSKLDWVIVGGESGPGARPMQPSWASDIVQQCATANVPCFVKQMGSVWAVRTNPFSDRLTNVRQQGDTKGAKMEYWPEDLRIREYPE